MEKTMKWMTSYMVRVSVRQIALKMRQRMGGPPEQDVCQDARGISSSNSNRAYFLNKNCLAFGNNLLSLLWSRLRQG